MLCSQKDSLQICFPKEGSADCTTQPCPLHSQVEERTSTQGKGCKDQCTQQSSLAVVRFSKRVVRDNRACDLNSTQQSRDCLLKNGSAPKSSIPDDWNCRVLWTLNVEIILDRKESPCVDPLSPGVQRRGNRSCSVLRRTEFRSGSIAWHAHKSFPTSLFCAQNLPKFRYSRFACVLANLPRYIGVADCVAEAISRSIRAHSRSAGFAHWLFEARRHRSAGFTTSPVDNAPQLNENPGSSQFS
jgi:hypothetical protein